MGALPLAVKAEDAVALLEYLLVEGSGTMVPAVAAVGAKPDRQPPEKGKAADKPEQRAQRAEVPAPVPALEPFEKKDAQEKEERDKGEGVEGVAKREQIALEEAVARVQVVPRIAEEAVKPYPALAAQKPEKGIQGEGQEADEDCHGVQKTGEIHVEKGREEDE